MQPKEIAERDEIQKKINAVAEKEKNQFIQTHCKSLKSVTIDWDKEDKDNPLALRGYKLLKVGCENERRNGSAYCQDCSDKHHANNS